MATRNIQSDPLRNFKFRVEIVKNTTHGFNMAGLGFMAASGLAASTEPISYREGGDNTTPRKMPGQTDFPPVSLTRGMVDSADTQKAMWDWYTEIFHVTGGAALGGPSDDFRADIYIKVYDHPVNRGPKPHGVFGTVRAAWHLFNAWPAALAFSDLDAGGNGVIVNNLTLMHEGFDFRVANRGDRRLDSNIF